MTPFVRGGKMPEWLFWVVFGPAICAMGLGIMLLGIAACVALVHFFFATLEDMIL